MYFLLIFFFCSVLLSHFHFYIFTIFLHSNAFSYIVFEFLSRKSWQLEFFFYLYSFFNVIAMKNRRKKDAINCRIARIQISNLSCAIFMMILIHKLYVYCVWSVLIYIFQKIENVIFSLCAVELVSVMHDDITI